MLAKMIETWPGVTRIPTQTDENLHCDITQREMEEFRV